MKNLLLFTLCFCWGYARHSETPFKRKVQFLKLQPILLTEQVGAQVILNCPVNPLVVRMYRYLRRIKSGKELDYARRQLGQLMGIKYKWYKDNKAIQHHRSAWFMKLQAVQVEDEGVYTCKVSMPAKVGKKSQNFMLKVFKQLKSGRPILRSESKNITLRVGESTTLRCASRNTVHEQQIRWLKWNKPGALNRLGNQEFTQNDLKTQTFSCEGKEYELIEPKANGESISTSVRERLRRGKKEKSQEFRLTLDNVLEKDSGVYICLVRNKYGSDYRRFFVHVKSVKGLAPYPTHEKLRQNFVAFPALATKRLRCYVSGDQPLTYQWYKNGKKLTHSRLNKKINSTTSTLRLRNLLPSDSGLYTCRVSNPYGVYEENITLKVLQRIPLAPILLKDYPKNVTSSRGKTVEFKCIESILFPMPDYRWYKWHSVPATYPKLDFHNTSQFTEINPVHYTPMQVKIGSNSRYAGKLTLKNITEDDAGLYSCVLRNQFGMDYASAFLHLKSNEGPKFVSTINHPTLIKIPLQLDCDATGNPKPNITWFRNGRLLVLSSGMTMSNYTLTLKELSPGHSGNYTCEVKNKWGSIHRRFDVKIKESLFARPIIVPSSREILRIGQKHKFKCTIVSGEPIIPRMTRKLESNTEGAENLTSKAKLTKVDKHIYVFSYVIRNATINDSGIYSCVARNSIGESERKFHIQVEA